MPWHPRLDDEVLKMLRPAKVIVLGIVVASVQIGSSRALEPGDAGKQAHDELDALIAEQRQAKNTATELPKEQAKNSPGQTPPSAGQNRPSPTPASVVNSIPAVCDGCEAKQARRTRRRGSRRDG